MQNIHISFSNIEIIYGTSNDETWSPGCYLHLQQHNFAKFVDRCLRLLAVRSCCPSGTDFFSQCWSTLGCGTHQWLWSKLSLHAESLSIISLGHWKYSSLNLLSFYLFPYFLSLDFFCNSLFFLVPHFLLYSHFSFFASSFFLFLIYLLPFHFLQSVDISYFHYLFPSFLSCPFFSYFISCFTHFAHSVSVSVLLTPITH